MIPSEARMCFRKRCKTGTGRKVGSGCFSAGLPVEGMRNFVDGCDAELFFRLFF